MHWMHLRFWLVYYVNFQVRGCNNFQRIHQCYIFSYKSQFKKIWPCHEIGQVQLSVTIWINYDGLYSSMHRTKFHYNLPRLVPGKKIFYRVFTIIWPSWSCDQNHDNKFLFTWTLKLTYQIWLKRPCGFWERWALIFMYKWPWAQVKNCIFFNSIFCLHVQTFRSLAAKVSEISSFHIFLYKSH